MGDPTGVYVRISDDREGRELGVQRQEDDNRRAAERAGDIVVDVYKDNDISASTRSKKPRPDFLRMLADARAGRIKKIRAYTTSRLTRRPREFEDLIDLAERHGVKFEYVNSPSFDLNTAAGRHIARVLAAGDAARAEETSELIIRKQLQKVEAGEYKGGIRPFGYNSDGSLREAEADIIKSCTERLLAGESLHSMATELNAQGVLTVRGNKWRVTNLRQLLERPRNAGHLVYKGEIVGKGTWVPIISEDTHAAVKTLVADPARLTSTGSIQKWLGAGLFLCGVCGDGTTMKSSTTRGGHSDLHPRSYRCRASGHLVRIAAPVDDMVERAAVARLMREDAVHLLQPKDKSIDLNELRTEASAIRQRLLDLDFELDDRQITKANWTMRTDRLRKKLTGIEEQVAAATATNVLDGLAGAVNLPTIWYGELEDRSDGLPVGRRAAAVDALMVVTLKPARPGRKAGGGYFDPSCVQIDWRETH